MATARKTDNSADAWVSLKKAAEMLGESRQTTLARTVKGEVQAQHIAGRTVVLRASIEKLLANR